MGKPRAKQLGVTGEAYDALLAAQDGHCALCPNEPKTRRLHADHDHKTGEVRGLLCYRCNRALPGYVTAEWLRRAADYIAPKPRVTLPADLVTKPLVSIGGTDGQRALYEQTCRKP